MSEDKLISGANDGTLKIWDLSTTRCLHTVKMDGNPISIAMRSQDAGAVLVQTSHGAVVSVALIDAQQTTVWSSPSITCMALGDNVLYTGNTDGSICMLSLHDLQPKTPFTGHSKSVDRVRYYPPGVLVSNSHGEIRMWNIVKGTSIVAAQGNDFSLVDTISSGATLAVSTDSSIDLVAVQNVIKEIKVQNAISEIDTGSQELFLAHCELPSLPPELFTNRQYRHITNLHLNHNLITRLGSGLAKLKALVSIEAQHNKLTAVTSSLGKLANLEALLLGNNELDYFPGELGRLEHLDLLDLSQNKLQCLPASLAALSRLTTLFLHDNLLGGTSDASSGDADSIENAARTSSSGILSPRTAGSNLSLSSSMSSISTPIAARNLSLRPTISTGSPRAHISSAKETSASSTPSATPTASPSITKTVTKGTLTTPGAKSPEMPKPTKRNPLVAAEEFTSPRTPKHGPSAERRTSPVADAAAEVDQPEGTKRKNRKAPADEGSTSALRSASMRRSISRYSTLKVSAKFFDTAVLDQLAREEEEQVARKARKAARLEARGDTDIEPNTDDELFDHRELAPRVVGVLPQEQAVGASGTPSKSPDVPRKKKKTKKPKKSSKTGDSKAIEEEGNEDEDVPSDYPASAIASDYSAYMDPSPSDIARGVYMSEDDEEELARKRASLVVPLVTGKSKKNVKEGINITVTSSGGTTTGTATAAPSNETTNTTATTTELAAPDAKTSTSSSPETTHQERASKSDTPKAKSDEKSGKAEGKSNKQQDKPSKSSTGKNSAEGSPTVLKRQDAPASAESPDAVSPDTTPTLPLSPNTSPQVAANKSKGIPLALDKIPPRQASSIGVPDSTAAPTTGKAAPVADVSLPPFVPVNRTELLSDESVKTQVYLEDLDFGQLRSLRLLHLQANHLTSVPKSMGYCTSLTDLDLAENRLREFSPYLCELTGLLRLSLTDNMLTRLPPQISKLTRLTELYLDENKLDEIPSGLSTFVALRVLHVSHNRLHALPHNFGKLPQLTELNLSHNELKELPSEVVTLKSLAFLAIDANRLKQLPVDLFYLSSLRSLEARDNLLTSVPYASLLRIECLQLDNNQIQAIPPAIEHLQNVADLSFNSNPLREVPEEIVYLGNLVRLDLSNMPIAQIPESLCLLPKLKKLILNDNDNMTWPHPQQVEELETESLLDAMTKDRFGTLKEFSYNRLCLVGLEGAGKTSLFNYLKSGKAPKKSKSTRGIVFDTWAPKMEVKDGGKALTNKFSFNVWDFSGSEDYRPLHHIFLNDGAVYIVVWNLALDESRSTIGYWLNTIMSQAGADAPVIIVGTHLDNLKDSEKITSHLENTYHNAQYPNVRAVVAVSSSTGENIDRLAKKICQLAYDLRRGAMVPSAFSKLMNAIPKDVSTAGPAGIPTPIVETHNFEKFLSKYGVDEFAATATLRYLNAAGAVVNLQSTHFDDLSGVIVDPAWFVSIYADLFAQRAKFVQNGLLRQESLDAVFKESGLPSVAFYTLVAVLNKLEICFDDANHAQKSSRNFYANQTFPAFLAEAVPENLPWPALQAGLQEISLSYHFSFLPGSFMSKLMSRLFKKLKAVAYWRHGFVVHSLPDVLNPTSDPEMSAYLELNPLKDDLKMWIRGSHMYSCMKMLQGTILQVLASYRIPPTVQLQRHLHCAFKTTKETQVELVAVSMHKVEYELSRGVTILQLTTGGQIPLTRIYKDMEDSRSSE